MTSQRTKFEHWSKGLPENTRYLIDLVQERILPAFLDKGFFWVDDYAEGKASEVGANEIPLQVQSSDSWPTIQIFFAPNSRPWFRLDFGLITDACYRYDGKLLSKKKATLSYAPARFSLAKDQGSVSSLFTQFGYHWFSFFPKRKLSSEVESASKALGCVFEFFEKGIADPWPNIKDGYVSKNIYKQFRPAFPLKTSPRGAH